MPGLSAGLSAGLGAGRFDGATAIVTGAASGIGTVIAGRLLAEGARVVVADRSDDTEAATEKLSVNAPGRVMAVRVDVADPASVEAMAARTLDRFGTVDVLVNNAAIAEGDNVIAMEVETWDADVAVVLRGAFLCTKAVLKPMIDQGRGAIVNIVSVNALGFYGNEAYSAAKAGVVNLTKSIAVRYGRYGVRCNAVAPGSIRTPTWEQRLERDPEVLDRVARWYPLGRVGEPEDVAMAALFLASDEAAWVTGAVLAVDGGLTAGNGVMMNDLLVEARDPDTPGSYGA